MTYRRRGTVPAGARPHAGSRVRRTALFGAVGAIGFAVYYFLDPELGPRRRREVVDAVHDAAAPGVSQELVARLVEPPAVRAGPSPPSVATGPPRSRSSGASSSTSRRPTSPAALHDEVSFFTVGDDSRLSRGGSRRRGRDAPEPMRVAEASVHEGPGYAVWAAAAADHRLRRGRPGLRAPRQPARVEPEPPADAVEARTASRPPRSPRSCWPPRRSAPGRSGAATTAAPRLRACPRARPRRSSSSRSRGRDASPCTVPKETMVLVVTPSGERP